MDTDTSMGPPASPVNRRKTSSSVHLPPQGDIRVPGMASSSAGSEPATPGSTTSDAFSRPTRSSIRERTSNECWACGALHSEAAHVFGEHDHQADLWWAKNLINYDIRSPDNGVALCPICHYFCDRFEDPGFVFFPTDLQYFIDYELNDRELRRNTPGLPRTVPSGQEYRQHLIQNGLLSESSTGCMYRVVYLWPYLGRERGTGLISPKMWHGAPLATLRRAFFVLAGGRISVLDPDIRLQLERLRNLYFLDDNHRPQTSKGKRSANDQDSPPPPKRPTQSSAHVKDKSTTLKTGNERVGEDGWALGPNYTSNLAVDHFKWMFA